MLKKIILFCFLIIFASFSVFASDVSATSAVVLDVQTGRIVYEKNAHEKRAMASTTKLMTALLCQEYIEGNSDIEVLVSEEVANTEGSSAGLKKGDKIKLSELIVATLLPSGNDASNAIANAITDDFQKLAREKAFELGMNDTNIITASGLDADEHYSTAYDMALLMRECLKNPNLKKVMGSSSLEINLIRDDENMKMTFQNHNKLLSMYEYCDAGKTGYTNKAGRCLVTSATKNNLSLVAVTLNAPNDWQDHQNMYEDAFSKVQDVSFDEEYFSQAIAEGNDVKLRIPKFQTQTFFCDDIKKVIFIPRFIYYSSYDLGEQIGEVRYYIDQKEIFKNKIIKE